MTMTISTQVTKMEPDFENGQMILGNVTVVVNFQDGENYFGGQVVLTKDEEAITFTTTSDKIQELAIKKAKEKIAASELASNIHSEEPQEEEKPEETQQPE